MCERLPDVARAVHAAGHEIGNHSHTHPLFCFRSPRFIQRDLARAQQAIADATRLPAAGWFRAPFGVRWFGFRRRPAPSGTARRHVDRNRL